MAENKGIEGTTGEEVEEHRDGECLGVSRLVEDSGTESGDDRKVVEEEAVEEVRGALERLRGVLPKLAGRLGGSVTDLVAKLQLCLPTPAPPPRRKHRRFHTIGATAADLAAARAWITTQTNPKPSPIERCRFEPATMKRAGYFMEPAPQTGVLSFTSPPPVGYDPSAKLFTPAQSVQIAVHKAAIKKQISREEERRRESDSEESSEEDVSSAQRLLQLATEPRGRRKQRVKRSNTVDIPRPATYYESSDTASADELAYNSDRPIKRKSCGNIHRPPTFIAKTENDVKFLNFLNQVENSSSKVISYNPSARGGKHWSHRFSRIKTAFEEFSGDEKETKSKKIDNTESKMDALSKPSWCVKQEGDVIVGSITVAKRAPGPVNQFTHAPMSAFKPVDKKASPFPSSVSGSVKQLASQKFSAVSSELKIAPSVPPRTHSKLSYQPPTQSDQSPLSQRFVPNKSVAAKQYPPPQSFLNHFTPQNSNSLQSDKVLIKSPNKHPDQSEKENIHSYDYNQSLKNKFVPTDASNHNSNWKKYHPEPKPLGSKVQPFTEAPPVTVAKVYPLPKPAFDLKTKSELNISFTNGSGNSTADTEPIYQNVVKKSVSSYIPESVIYKNGNQSNDLKGIHIGSESIKEKSNKTQYPKNVFTENTAKPSHGGQKIVGISKPQYPSNSYIENSKSQLAHPKSSKPSNHFSNHADSEIKSNQSKFDYSESQLSYTENDGNQQQYSSQYSQSSKPQSQYSSLTFSSTSQPKGQYSSQVYSEDHKHQPLYSDNLYADTPNLPAPYTSYPYSGNAKPPSQYSGQSYVEKTHSHPQQPTPSYREHLDSHPAYPSHPNPSGSPYFYSPPGSLCYAYGGVGEMLPRDPPSEDNLQIGLKQQSSPSIITTKSDYEKIPTFYGEHQKYSPVRASNLDKTVFTGASPIYEEKVKLLEQFSPLEEQEVKKITGLFEAKDRQSPFSPSYSSTTSSPHVVYNNCREETSYQHLTATDDRLSGEVVEEKAVVGRVMGEAQCQRGAISHGARHRFDLPVPPPRQPAVSPPRRSPAKPLSPSFPNVLQKSESWHQMVKEQMSQARQAPPLPKVTKTKSSHSLAFPKQYEALLTPETLTHKQSTVSQYLSKTQANRTSDLKTQNTSSEEVENVDEAFESIFQSNLKKSK